MTKKPLTRSEINQKSDAKAGRKVKGFNMLIKDIELINQLSEEHNISGANLVVDAVKFYKKTI